MPFKPVLTCIPGNGCYIRHARHSCSGKTLSKRSVRPIADRLLQDSERIAEISREIGLDQVLEKLGVNVAATQEDSDKTVTPPNQAVEEKMIQKEQKEVV